MEEKIVTIKNIVDALAIFNNEIIANISIHNKKSFNKDIVYCNLNIPLDKALKIFGNVETMYLSMSRYEIDGFNKPCVRFEIVIE